MRFTPAQIPDVLLIEPDVHADSRGSFFESYRKDEFIKNGVTAEFIQDNHSVSVKGVLRGLHLQTAPMEQAKLVRVIRGEVFDVAVDMRRSSPTFGKYVSQHLSSQNKKMLFVPVGFAHGYLTLSDEAEFLYKTSKPYSPSHERGLRWDDPDIRVSWPKMDKPYILADKDKMLPGLKEIKL